MRRKLTKIGNSSGLILSRELLELLGVGDGDEVEVQLAGNTLVVTAPDVGNADVEAALAYIASKLARAEASRRRTAGK